MDWGFSLFLLTAGGISTALAWPLTGFSLSQRLVAAAGLVPVPPLLIAGVLLPVGAFSRATLLAGLSIWILAASVLAWRNRASFEWRDGLWYLVPLASSGAIYAACNATKAAVYEEYTQFYLSFGSWFDSAETAYPFFLSHGHQYVYPFTQAKYALAFPTYLLAGGDHTAYYLGGMPVVATLTGACVFAATFLWLRRHLPWAVAVVLTSALLSTIHAYKMASVRAETIAWVPGIAFLSALSTILSVETKRRQVGAWALAAVLLATATLIHGVVGVYCIAFAVGMYSCRFFSRSLRGRRLEFLSGPAAGLLVFIALVGTVFVTVHWMHTRAESRSFFEMKSTEQRAGEVDPATTYFALFTQTDPPPEFARFRSSPPAVSLWMNLKLVLLYPILDLSGNFGRFRPRWLWIAGIGCWLAVLITGRWKRIPFQLVVGAFATVLFLTAFSVYLNYTSVGWFPWAVAPRRFPKYISGMTAFVLTMGVMITLDWLIRNRRPRQIVGVAAAVFALALSGWSCFNSRLPSRSDSPYLTEDFMEVVRYLGRHGKTGDRAIANFCSLFHMSYLTGIPFLSEGVQPYEVTRLIADNAKTMSDIKEFFLGPNEDFLDRYGIRFVVFSKTPVTPGKSSFVFQQRPRPPDFRGMRLAVDNSRYSVWVRVGAEPGER